MLTAVYNYPECGYAPPSELVIGKEYAVVNVIMGGFHTSVWLEGFAGAFNSVNFDFFENGKPHDIYKDPKYNPYLGGY